MSRFIIACDTLAAFVATAVIAFVFRSGLSPFSWISRLYVLRRLFALVLTATVAARPTAYFKHAFPRFDNL